MDENKFIIREVIVLSDCYQITTYDSSCFIIKKKYNIIPKVDDYGILYTKQFSLIRGISLNDKLLFYKSDAELEDQRIKDMKNRENDKKIQFKKNRNNLDIKYNSLSEIFKQRIDKFRKNNPYFRIEYESSELFVCQQAIEILKYINKEEDMIKFSELSFDEQIKIVPTLDGGHSGNTFNITLRLAYWYIKDMKSVINVPGALEYLVGSKDYGGIYNEELWAKYKLEQFKNRKSKLKNILV